MKLFCVLSGIGSLYELLCASDRLQAGVVGTSSLRSRHVCVWSGKCQQAGQQRGFAPRIHAQHIVSPDLRPCRPTGTADAIPTILRHGVALRTRGVTWTGRHALHAAWLVARYARRGFDSRVERLNLVLNASSHKIHINLTNYLIWYLDSKRALADQQVHTLRYCTHKSCHLAFGA